MTLLGNTNTSQYGEQSYQIYTFLKTESVMFKKYVYIVKKCVFVYIIH